LDKGAFSMKFSIRDLLLLTVIVALAVGWWVDRAPLSAEIERLERLKRIQELPILDSYDHLPASQAPAPNPPKNQSGPHPGP
jgi:hypothetical protein